MIKAVLDTNVFISALFWKGAPYKIMQKGLSGQFIICSSVDILEEIKNKLLGKFEFPADDTVNFIEIITINSQIIEPKIKLNVVKDDFSDNKILECAIAGNADYVVSGDKHLLNIKEYKGIKIFSPSEFLKII